MAVAHSVVLYEPAETSPEVTNAAGFLAGYSGRTTISSPRCHDASHAGRGPGARDRVPRRPAFAIRPPGASSFPSPPPNGARRSKKYGGGRAGGV